MNAANNKILLRVNMEQKGYMTIGNTVLKTSSEYDPNYRERSPVVAEALEFNNGIKKGDILLCHHNMFYGETPYWVKDDIFSIPCKQTTIFAKIGTSGNPKAVLGNVIGERVFMPSQMDLPPEQRKYYLDRVKLLSNGFGYKKGQLIFHRPYAWYEIVYMWGNYERRVIKVNTDMVIGYEV